MAEDCNLQKGRQTPKPGSITVYHGSNPPQCNKGRSLTAVPAGWPLLVWLQLNFLLDPFNWRQRWNAHCTVDSEISQAHRSMSLLRTAASTQRTLTDSQASLKSDAKSKVTMRVKRRKDESSCKMVRCSPSATQKPTLWPHLSVQYFNRGNPRTRHPCEVSQLNSCKHRQLWSTEEKWLEDKHRGSRSFPHGVCKLLNVGGARVLAWTEDWVALEETIYLTLRWTARVCTTQTFLRACQAGYVDTHLFICKAKGARLSSTPIFATRNLLLFLPPTGPRQDQLWKVGTEENSVYSLTQEWLILTTIEFRFYDKEKEIREKMSVSMRYSFKMSM